ncbi:MAG: FAD-binding protein [Candidatus Geothermincolia bacterium]
MHHTDLLIIGSGFAGLLAAIEAGERGARDITIVDKGAVGLSSASKMAAGATIYCLPQFDASEWLEDFAAAQGWLCRQDMVARMLETSSERLERLRSWGIEYMRLPVPFLGSRGYVAIGSRGLDRARMLVAPRWKDKKGGSALVKCMVARARRSRPTLMPKTMITSLIVEGGRVRGACGVDRLTGEPRAIRAGAVVLAAGDCSFRGQYACVGQVTGDGFKLAYDAGARLTNMEFLAVNTGSPRYGFEGTGIAARFGGRFLDSRSRPFMRGHHPDGDRAEIGNIVQAIAAEAREGNGPPFYLDMSRFPGGIVTRRGLKAIGGWMPLNIGKLEAAGVRLFGEPQEWGPAIQSLRGGARTDAECLTDVSGLYAAGLAQSVDPGVFNGWSSMRAMWSGQVAGSAAADYVSGLGQDSGNRASDSELFDEQARLCLAPLERSTGPAPDEVCRRLQEAIFPCGVSIRKSEGRLRDALALVRSIRDNDLPVLAAADPHELVKAHETANMVLSAELFLLASLERRESRGDHFREDYPARDDAWLKWINIRRGEDGEPAIEHESVPLATYPSRPKGWAG